MAGDKVQVMYRKRKGCTPETVLKQHISKTKKENKM